MAEDKKTKEYQLKEVPTQMGIAIETPEGEIWDFNRAVVELLNKVDKIEKAVAQK